VLALFEPLLYAVAVLDTFLIPVHLLVQQHRAPMPPSDPAPHLRLVRRPPMRRDRNRVFCIQHFCVLPVEHRRAPRLPRCHARPPAMPLASRRHRRRIRRRCAALVLVGLFRDGTGLFYGREQVRVGYLSGAATRGAIPDARRRARASCRCRRAPTPGNPAANPAEHAGVTRLFTSMTDCCHPTTRLSHTLMLLNDRPESYTNITQRFAPVISECHSTTARVVL